MIQIRTPRRSRLSADRSSEPDPSLPISGWETLRDPVACLLLGVDDLLRWGLRTATIVGATQASANEIDRLRRQRLSALVGCARHRSPLYAERLAGLPDDAPLERLPITSREHLMGDFDRWVTDPQLQLDEIREFIADPSRIGEPYLGRYAIWTSSGTSGIPGIYVIDADALAVYEALSSTRSACGVAGPTLWQAMLGGSRIAMVAATSGHFAGIATWERMRRLHPWLGLTARAFSILEPIDRLVAALNDWQPAMLSSYPSLLTLLAEEQAAGRLQIAPQLLMSGGETLPAAQAHWLAERFGCPVRDEYGASECMNMAFSCGEGNLHLNADWVILEPVDDRGRPVPPGEPSADVLLTNLCNHVQPILRYPLGDRVTLLPGRCECGCPLPRLRVSGRHDDVLQLPDQTGREIRILPLALETLIEELGDVGSFQVRQTAADRLSIRLQTDPSIDRATLWTALQARLARWLALQGVHARLELDPEPPAVDPRTGKLRRVIARPAAQEAIRRTAPLAGRARPRRSPGSGSHSAGR
jgi:phenylacetate-coenzyme A ligase PaaK-like adenylate-forming protein